MISTRHYGWGAVVYLVSWKTGTVTHVSGFSKFVLNPHEYLKLRRLPTTTPRHGRSMAVSINSSLVSLIADGENRLEICKLELDPVPRLKTLCFLELPPLTSGTSDIFVWADKEWVPTSKSYVRTRSSRGYHLPFYSSAIGTMALCFHYLQPWGFVGSCTLIISVAGLISAIPIDARNVPWEDWGPSNTHFFKTTTELESVGPFWISDYPSLVVHQYDLQHTRYTQLMAGDGSSLQSRPHIVDSEENFQYDIKTHLPYRDVMMENKDLRDSGSVVADREWVVGVKSSVRGCFVHTVGSFRCESDHSQGWEAQAAVTVIICHVG